MSSDFDILVVGSGPAGVSAAFPLVEAGLRVLMVDGGQQSTLLPRKQDYLSSRMNDEDQWKWIVGEDFHALKMRDAVSPKLRVPSHAYAFEGFEHINQISGEDFIAVGSLSKGGLSNAWGCGVSRLSASELAECPFLASEMLKSYATVSHRVGISGRNDDDMANYFGLDECIQSPIQLDELHTRISSRYEKKRLKLNSQGFRLGRSRITALSADMEDRQACQLSNNCLWGCAQRSLYSAAYDLFSLYKHGNFQEISGFVVDCLSREGESWVVGGQTTKNGERSTIKANKIVLAAGALATTRIVLQALNHRIPVSLLSCPSAAFLLWLPSMLGVSRKRGFGLGQLSFTFNLSSSISAFGSTFSTTGILVSEFANHIPMGRRNSIDLLKILLSSCVVGNLFLPGDLTNGEAKLREDNSLRVSGEYHEKVLPLMKEARRKLSSYYLSLGAVLLPGSFTIGSPGADIHYSGSLPMRDKPLIGETSSNGEVQGLAGVYVVDGACMPILPAKSPTLTIMANADRIGNILAQLAKRK